MTLDRYARPIARSETLDGRVSSGTDTDPLDLDAQKVFDKLDILLAVFGERLESGAFRDVGLPTGEGDVFDFDVAEQVEVGWEAGNKASRRGSGSAPDLDGKIRVKARVRGLTREAFDLFPIELVLGGDLDLLEPVENVELGQVERGVSVDHGRVTHDDEVEPTASTPSTGSDSPLSADLLELNADVL